MCSYNRYCSLKIYELIKYLNIFKGNKTKKEQKSTCFAFMVARRRWQREMVWISAHCMPLF